MTAAPAAFLSAQESDPRAFGWMEGSPPPPGRCVALSDMGVYQFPKTRWAFAHFREFFATRHIARAHTPSTLTTTLRDDIDAVTFTPMGSSSTMTWQESLAANYTDAILVLHKGAVVYERYLGIMHATQPHIAASVTKSYTGTLAAMLVHAGELETNRQVLHYIPELKGSAYEGASVREVMDMLIGVQYSENYADPHAQIWAHLRAGNMFPRPRDYSGPEGFYAFLCSLQKEGKHGEGFTYKTVNTDVLGWLITRITGKKLAALIEECFWQPLGCACDAYITIDTQGTDFAGGGLSMTLRDAARFGEALRCEGFFNEQQVIPAAVVADIARGANRDHFASAGFATLPGWSYRSMWWVSHNAHGAYSARGVHGQVIYIDPKAQMVIARFGSHPLAANPHLDPTSLPAYHALARHLLQT